MSAFDVDEIERGLLHGDFTRMAPAFEGEPPQIVDLCERGAFDDKPAVVAEALSCACFLGRTEVASYFLKRGIDPAAGNATGLNALHWAVNRGNLDTVRLLLRHNPDLEIRNMYSGTVLGIAVWSAMHEPRADHLLIIEELLQAGARVDAIDVPTGHAGVDALIERYRT